MQSSRLWLLSSAPLSFSLHYACTIIYGFWNQLKNLNYEGAMLHTHSFEYLIGYPDDMLSPNHIMIHQQNILLDIQNLVHILLLFSE